MTGGAAWASMLNTFGSGTGAFLTDTPTGGFNVMYGGGTLGTFDGGSSYSFDYDYVFAGNNADALSNGDEQNIGAAYIDTGSSIEAYPPGGVWIGNFGASGLQVSTAAAP